MASVRQQALDDAEKERQRELEKYKNQVGLLRQIIEYLIFSLFFIIIQDPWVKYRDQRAAARIARPEKPLRTIQATGRLLSKGEIFLS